jgi:hypothetical protein
VKATGAAHVKTDLPKKASGKGKAMEEPSAEAMTGWENFEQAYKEVYQFEYGEVLKSDYMAPGWPDSKRQALQRFEYAVANKEGFDPVAVLRSVTPAIWQNLSLTCLDDARPNPLYLLKIAPLLCARYRAELLKATKAKSHRAFKAFDGVRAMRARVKSAVKKAIKQQGNGWLKEQTEAEIAETAVQAEAAKKKAVQLAIEQHEKWEATNAEGLLSGDPMALPPYQESKPPPKAPPVIAAAPVEVTTVAEPAAEPSVPDIDYEAMGLKPPKTPEQREAELAAFAKAFKAHADAQRYAEEQARLKKKAEAEAAHAATTQTKLKKHILSKSAV